MLLKAKYLILLKWCFAFSFLLCFSLNSYSQKRVQQNEALAKQYFEKGEYDKAAALYEDLYDDQPFVFYKPYLATLLALKNYEKAEKIIKKSIKKNQADLSPYVDWGYMYKLQEKPDKAKEYYEKAIKELKPSQEQAMQLSTSFLERKEPDYAIATLIQGRKLLNGAYGFYFELADLYARKQDTKGMLTEYLNVLEFDGSFLQNVQSLLQNYLFDDIDNQKKEFIRTTLIKRVQNNPDNGIFVDLLVWSLIQLKDFESAYTQVRAIDARRNEEGTGMYQLAEICVSNDQFEIAAKCYQYLISKGRNNSYYVAAKVGLLRSQYKKITGSYGYTQVELINLEKEFTATITELGKNEETASLMEGLAYLKGFYLNKGTEAITILQEVLDISRVSAQFKAHCKLEMGDIYLLNDNIWDATLLYSQVDLDYKNDPMGEEAKFRNARLSYYNGEFLWAQGQLDVLKGSTEHLISNDALALSLLIQENAPDSDYTALEMYAAADLMAYRNDMTNALQKLDSIMMKYPKHPIIDDVLLKKSEIYKKQANFITAAEQLQKLVTEYPTEILADKGLYELALLYELYLKNKEKAMELYQQLLTKYSGSTLMDDARKHYRALRGDNVQ